MADNVHELRPKAGDSEKVTINLGYVDLGHIDLLVREGFYSNRTDLIRTAIRNQLERHAAAVDRSVTRQSLDPGLRHYSRADLEAVLAAGEKLRDPRPRPRHHRARRHARARARHDRLARRAGRPPRPFRRQGRPRRPHPLMPRPMSLLEKAETMSNDPRLPDLAEATRLTRAGRLQRRPRLIQGLLRGEKPAPAEPAARTIDAAAETIEVTDRPAAAAPTPEAGGWRMPEGLRDLAGKFRATGGVEGRATPARDAAPVGGWRMPEGLRDLVDKFGRGAGNVGDVEGWARPAPTPDVVPVGGRWIAGSYADGAGTRGYKLYVPSGYTGSRCRWSSCCTAAPSRPTTSPPARG